MADRNKNKSTKRLTVKQKGGSNFAVSYDLEAGSLLPIGKWDSQTLRKDSVGMKLAAELGKMQDQGFIPEVLLQHDGGFIVSIVEI